MIRVNLLPIRQARRRRTGRTQLLLFTGLILVEVLILGILWLYDSATLSNVEADVAQYQKDVNAAKQEVADANELEKRKDQLEKQLGILTTLESSRSGPVRMMDEFQAILSKPRNDEDRFAMTNKDWDVDWDSRRVWIYELKEQSANFTIHGGAVDSNDVAEFLRRMISAKHFDQVELDLVESKADKDGPRYVEFKIFGKILYTPPPKPAAAAKQPVKTDDKKKPAGKPQPKKGT